MAGGHRRGVAGNGSGRGRGQQLWWQRPVLGTRSTPAGRPPAPHTGAPRGPAPPAPRSARAPPAAPDPAPGAAGRPRPAGRPPAALASAVVGSGEAGQVVRCRADGVISFRSPFRKPFKGRFALAVGMHPLTAGQRERQSEAEQVQLHGHPCTQPTAVAWGAVPKGRCSEWHRSRTPGRAAALANPPLPLAAAR